MGGRLLRSLGWTSLLALVAVASAAYIEEEFQTPPARPAPHIHWPPPPPLPPRRTHVPELARFLDQVQVRRPLVWGRLAVFPLCRRTDGPLPGRWWSADDAIRHGILVVTERGESGTVPFVSMANRSRHDYVFVMAGEVITGGKQTRTVRQDVVLAPGQRVDVGVFCVEAHRWRGDADFAASGLFVPQSLQKELRRGTDQAGVWSEVARSNAALRSENATGSLELGLKAAPVARELDQARSAIVPHAPPEAVGFVFADRLTQRALGAELFGRTDLATALLPKLLDAYAVDVVLQQPGHPRLGPLAEEVAHHLLRRLRRAGSLRTSTPGSGAGIRLRGAGLVGDGVTCHNELVHFGCQVEERIVPPPVRRFGPNPPALRE